MGCDTSPKWIEGSSGWGQTEFWTLPPSETTDNRNQMSLPLFPSRALSLSLISIDVEAKHFQTLETRLSQHLLHCNLPQMQIHETVQRSSHPTHHQWLNAPTALSPAHHLLLSSRPLRRHRLRPPPPSTNLHTSHRFPLQHYNSWLLTRPQAWIFVELGALVCSDGCAQSCS